jgi:hypothetical protein
MAVPRQHLDDGVEVAMFHVQFNNPAVDVLCVGHGLLFQTVLLQKRRGASAWRAYNLCGNHAPLARIKCYGLQHRCSQCIV